MEANTYRNSLSATTAAAGGGGGMPALQNSTAAQLKCPRCDSTNTKFCYYNNYSLAQPRHFCKACKRYWTQGGTLRDVPVGGGCRKYKCHKKPQSAIAAALSSTPALRRLANTLPPPASDLCSPIYGMPSTNLSNLFFPRFEETNQRGIGRHLVDNLQKSAEAGKSYQAPLPSYDDLRMGLCEGLSLIKDNPMVSNYSFGGSGSAAAESAYLYSLPESCSSMVRLP